MAERKAVTKQLATSYRRQGPEGKDPGRGRCPDRLHRDRARAVLRHALDPPRPRRVRPGRAPVYGADLRPALVRCWAVLRAPAGKLLAAVMPELVPMRREENVPGFVEIDLVGHDGSNTSGQFCFPLTVTDITTGWTVNRSVPNRAQKHVFAALQHAMNVFPFPVIGINSDNGRASLSATSSSTQQRALRLLPGTRHHIDTVPAQQQERRRLCGAEKLGPGP
jgi:hypothetical protein